MKNYKALYQKSQIEMQQYIDYMNKMNSDSSTVFGHEFNDRKWEQLLLKRDGAIYSNRYVWKEMPFNLTSQQLEYFFYQNGSLCFFMHDGKLKVGSYAQKGGLTSFGNLEKIIPIDFAGKSYETEYNVVTKIGDAKRGDKVAIVINDSTQLFGINAPSQYGINKATTVREQVFANKVIVSNLALTVKKLIALCENEDQRNAVEKQLRSLLNPNSPLIAISKSNGKGIMEDIETFAMNQGVSFADLMQVSEYYDKIRNSYNGVSTPSAMEKKERLITGEIKQSNLDSKLVLEDGLMNRKYGLELMQEYLPIQGLENASVDLNEILKEDAEEPNVNQEGENEGDENE